MFVLSLITVLFWGVVLIDALIGFRTLYKLEDYAETTTNSKKLSVIIAARNEEADLLKSVESQLQQTYRYVEWIIVNDRSTDNTGETIDNLAKKYKQITPIHIEQLPKGWLGKNYALYEGYLHSSGEYLLFTDADVIFEKEAFAKALSFLEQEKIEHLTLAPHMNVKGFWLQAFVSFFFFGLSYFKRPWAANNDKSKQGMGIGAFNLITRRAYEQIGTHEGIAHRPDDDLQLGLKIKEHGLKQRIASAVTLVSVKWYHSLSEAIAGLEKNTFAGLHFRFSMVILAVVGVFLSQVWPFFAVFIYSGIVQLLYLISILLLFLLYRLTTRKISALPTLNFIVFPLTALLFIYTIIRAVALTFMRGGIIWRGTFYDLKELKKLNKGKG
ncbi:glycosyltransferase [Anaerobacillus sp. MEB173]|uniref:glycosyltransferase n=1 Tax=Anaerobacillus sp. MEB173 TaxID=3383345 RepID=UPI003F8F8521